MTTKFSNFSFLSVQDTDNSQFMNKVLGCSLKTDCLSNRIQNGTVKE